MKTERLYFIDAVRAFAILMMLQGHFIDTLLNPVYRSTNNLLYLTWEYCRGITAPTFFTISGLIFLYLLLKARNKGKDNFRIKKGLQRGILLIVVGYTLRMDLFGWIRGEFDKYFLVVDVLQCIGLSLIMLIGFYVLLRNQIRILSILLIAVAIFCFITEPLYRSLNLETLPLFFANYMTKNNGSIFTILPWFGFTAFGGFIATIFFNHAHRNRFRLSAIFCFVIFGLFLLNYSSWILMRLFYLTDYQILKDVAYYNYLFMRLGNVLLLFGIFYGGEFLLRQPIISKIGQKTLSIYVIHFIIIFGSFSGIGLKHFYLHSLNPNQAIIGALVFMFSVCLISFYYAKTNAYVYGKLSYLFNKIQNKSSSL